MQEAAGEPGVRVPLREGSGGGGRAGVLPAVQLQRVAADRGAGRWIRGRVHRRGAQLLGHLERSRHGEGNGGADMEGAC